VSVDEAAGNDGELVHLVCGFDEGYARPAGVMLRSVARTLRPGARCVAHVVGIDLSTGSKAKLAALGTDDLEIRFVDFDMSWIDKLPSYNPAAPHLNSTVYISLMTDRFLPEEVTRYVKLDGDMIVRASLDEIANVDLEGKVLGAMQDFYIPTVSMYEGVARWRDIGLDSRTPYFNGGMLVVDRQAWRAFEVERKAVEYLDRYRADVSMFEQEAFNVIFAGDWKRLPARWNYMVFIEDLIKVNMGYAYAFLPGPELDEARTNPAIVHFASPEKPWIERSTVPFRDDWWEVAADSPWSSQPADPARRPDLVQEAKRRLRCAARLIVKGY
jgi:lipopolysaccharide biosynthesis glycosyltransferase